MSHPTIELVKGPLKEGQVALSDLKPGEFTRILNEMPVTWFGHVNGLGYCIERGNNLMELVGGLGQSRSHEDEDERDDPIAFSVRYGNADFREELDDVAFMKQYEAPDE